MGAFLFSAFLVLFIAGMVFVVWTNRRRKSLLPAVPESQIIYEEMFASAFFVDNPLMRIFGEARFGAHVVVTANELHIRSNVFQRICPAFASVHYIPKKYILSITEHEEFMRGKGVIIEYQKEEGTTERVFLVPQDYRPFRRALDQGRLPVG